jgi:hypothetical protein
LRPKQERIINESKVDAHKRLHKSAMPPTFYLHIYFGQIWTIKNQEKNVSNFTKYGLSYVLGNFVIN